MGARSAQARLQRGETTRLREPTGRARVEPMASVDAAEASPPRGPRSAVVVNPTKVEDAVRLRELVEEGLARAGWPAAEWFETTREDPGFGQAQQALHGGAKVVFACGGDGTVRQCVCALQGSDAALSVLPTGTGNLLALNLGLPMDVTANVDLATGGGRRRLDVGRVNDDCFIVMAGMGVDAEIVQQAPEGLKAQIGVWAYLWSTLKRLDDRPIRVRIRLDDAPPLGRKVRTVLVGRSPSGARKGARAAQTSADRFL